MGRGNPYPHRYEYGKQIELLSLEEISRRVSKANLSLEEESFFWLLHYCGIRKSEGYERIVEDFKETPDYLKVDFHKRKKGGAEVKPLKIPIGWEGVDKIIEQMELARAHKPRFKSVYFMEDTGEKKTTPTGKIKPVMKLAKKRVKARWVFPKIHSCRAWRIVKRVLGKKLYPHFLRLNCLTEIGSDPSANLTRLKTFSGIKSIRVLEGYLGTDEREADKAFEFRGKRMRD